MTTTESPFVDAEGTDQAHLRRKAELMGIVNGLQFLTQAKRKSSMRRATIAAKKAWLSAGRRMS